MSIQRRKNATGQMRYRVRVNHYNPDGTRRWIAVGTFGTLKEARAAEAKATEHRDRGTWLEKSTATVADVLTDWLTTKANDLLPNTVAEYRTTISTHLIPALGSVKMQALNHAAVQARVNLWVSEGMSPNTLRSCYLRLRAGCTYGVRMRLIESNPCDHVSIPRIPRPSFQVWDPAEARAFLTGVAAYHVHWHAKEPSRWLMPAVGWDLLLREGLRRGEMLGLRWKDVDLSRGTAHLTQTVVVDQNRKGAALVQERTKTAAGARTVRLTPETIAALESWRRRWAAAKLAAGDVWQLGDQIVCGKHGQPINPSNVDRSLSAICRFAQVRPVKPHALRHTCATLMLAAGVSPKVAQERLGHSSIATTLDLYSHLTPDAQETAAVALSRILAG